jgi:hypothetical protein
VGCASHRLNLGVKIVLQSYSWIIDRIHAVMVALRHLKARAALRKHKTLSPVLGNATRWSSTKTMIDRYFLLLEPIALIVPADLQLSPSENRLAKQLQVILVDLDVLTFTFQDEGLQMCDVRDYLDAAMKLFPELEEHCTADSRIVVDVHFESAVVKIQRAQQSQDNLSLSSPEEQTVAHLLKKQNISDERSEKERAESQDQMPELQTLLHSVEKRKKGPASTTAGSQYLDLRFIRPTTNICERQFSVSGFTYNKNRQGLLPTNLEMQLFLKANEHLWDAALFHTHE